MGVVGSRTFIFTVMMVKIAVLVFLCALTVRSSYGQQNGSQPMDVFRLWPSSTTPLSYDLRFTPVFNGVNSTFTGVAKITLTATSPGKVIVLNIKDLVVDTMTISDMKNQRNQSINKWVYNENNEQLEIYLDNSYISKRNYLLTIEYNGKIRNDMTGFYMSSYQENNQTK